MNMQNAFSVITAVVESLFLAGVIFGWPSLQYCLVEDGYFGYMCNETHNNASITRAINRSTEVIVDGLKSCSTRDEMFNLIFTLATSLLNIACFPIGYIFDVYGTWTMRTLASILYTLAYIFLTVMTVDASWMLFPAMIFVAIGGFSLVTSNIQVGNLVPGFRTVFITFIQGLFDSGTVTFFLVKIFFDQRFDLHHIFQVLACCTLLPWFRTFILMPKKHFPESFSASFKYGIYEMYKPSKNHRNNSTRPLKCSSKSLQVLQSDSNTPVVNVSIENKFKSNTPPMTFYLKMPMFWSNVFHVSFGNLRMSFFFGSLISWMEVFEAGEDISYYMNVFGFVLLTGALVAPLNGILAQQVTMYYKKITKDARQSLLKGLIASMTVTSILLVCLSAAVISRHIYLSFAFLLIFRSFLFGGNASFVALAFPTMHFGKLFGLTQTIVGFVALLQYGVFKLSLEFDPEFSIINYVLLALSAATFVHPFVIIKYGI